MRDGVQRAVNRVHIKALSVKDDIRPNNCAALTERHHRRLLFNLIKRVGVAALGTVKTRLVAVELKHTLATSSLMQSVDVLRHHRAQLSRSFQVSQPFVSNVWLSLPQMMRVPKIRVIRCGVIKKHIKREDLFKRKVWRLTVGKRLLVIGVNRYTISQVVGFFSHVIAVLAQTNGHVFYFDTALAIQTVSTPKIRNTAFR